MTIREILEKLDSISQECRSKVDDYVDVANQSSDTYTRELYTEWSSTYRAIAIDLDILVARIRSG